MERLEHPDIAVIQRLGELPRPADQDSTLTEVVEVSDEEFVQLKMKEFEDGKT